MTSFIFWRWLGAYSHSGFHLCVKFWGPPKLLKMSNITLTCIFPAWGVLRQEDCCDLKASLGYIVRLFLSTNQKEEQQQNNHHFKLVFHVGLQFVSWNVFPFSTPNIPRTFFILCTCQAFSENGLRTSSRTSLNGSSDNLVLELGGCKCERHTQGYFSWDAKKMRDKERHKERQLASDSSGIWL